MRINLQPYGSIINDSITNLTEPYNEMLSEEDPEAYGDYIREEKYNYPTIT